MSNIELVIKIPEEIRRALINNIQLSIDQQSICDSCIKQAVVNGTTLQKGCGRLIDDDTEFVKNSAEAIKQIQNILDWSKNHDCVEIDACHEEALQMAIKALELNSDYIYCEEESAGK